PSPRLRPLLMSIALAGAMIDRADAVQAAEPRPVPKENQQRTSRGMSMDEKDYGITAAGAPIREFRLANENGIVVRLINYGAIVTSVETPDRNGVAKNITLGFDSLAGYEQRHPYFGATVGRF